MSESGSSRLFGMQPEQGRWIFIVLGSFINLCLGSVYSYSIFRKPLEELFSVGATQSGLPYVLVLAFFALLMPVTGGFLEKLGPRTISIIGGAFVGAGWMLSRWAPGIGVLALTYGVITGAGVGIAYGGPITTATRWFPDKKGLAVGLSLAGFGVSAMITAPLMRMSIEKQGPLQTFLIFGIIFGALIILCSLLLKFPADGWSPAGWTPPVNQGGTAAQMKPWEMVKTKQFYGLWISYIIGTLAGLMAIGIASPVGQEVIQLNSATAASLVSVFAIFNGVGRPLFGWLTDRITPRNAAVLSFIIIFMASVGMLFAGASSTALYVACFCGFWLALGGWLAIAPASTATFFGSKFYSKNYGFVFTAYGIGAVIGTLMSARLRDMLGSYVYAFYPTAALAVVGIFLSIFLLKTPDKQ